MATTIFPKTDTETRLVKACLLLLRAALAPAKNNPVQMSTNNKTAATDNFQWAWAGGATKCSSARRAEVLAARTANRAKKDLGSIFEKKKARSEDFCFKIAPCL